jgi:hypothetical protein
MLSGKYDHFFASATAQEPLFQLLGTAPHDKTRRTYDAGHDIPRTKMITEVVAWMDRYWGPPTPQHQP